MKTIIIGQKERVAQWVSSKMGKQSAWSAYEAIGLEQDGELIGGVVIDGYTRNVRCSIHCSGEGKKWLNRTFLSVVFGYVFNQLKCKAVVNPVDISNEASIRFTSHLGFTEAVRIPEAELVIFTMPRADCRWLNLKD